jgi:hypothetical protein
MAAQPAPLMATPTEESTTEDMASPDLGVRSVAELVAETLRGLHKVDEALVRLKATVGDDGYIDVEVTRVNFFGDNTTVRVLLYPTAAPVPPQPVPEPRSGGSHPGGLR